MKKGCFILIIVIAGLAFFVISLVVWGTKVYNNMVTMNEGVTSHGVMLKLISAQI